jgi:hypothetical protein
MTRSKLYLEYVLVCMGRYGIDVWNVRRYVEEEGDCLIRGTVWYSHVGSK